MNSNYKLRGTRMQMRCVWVQLQMIELDEANECKMLLSSVFFFYLAGVARSVRCVLKSEEISVFLICYDRSELKCAHERTDRYMCSKIMKIS